MTTANPQYPDVPKVSTLDELEAMSGIKKFDLSYPTVEWRTVTVRGKSLRQALRSLSRRLGNHRRGSFRIRGVTVADKSKDLVNLSYDKIYGFRYRYHNPNGTPINVLKYNPADFKAKSVYFDPNTFDRVPDEWWGQ